MAYSSHESYFADVEPEIRLRLASIQEEVESRLPGVARCISYNMPAFKAGRVFFYFAAFKKHIGVYPPVTQDDGLITELAPYRGPKGNLTFAHEDPLPLELIGRVAVALHLQYQV